MTLKVQKVDDFKTENVNMPKFGSVLLFTKKISATQTIIGFYITFFSTVLLFKFEIP